MWDNKERLQEIARGIREKELHFGLGYGDGPQGMIHGLDAVTGDGMWLLNPVDRQDIIDMWPK